MFKYSIIIILKYFKNEWIKNGDHGDDINELKKKLWYYSKGNHLQEDLTMF